MHIYVFSIIPNLIVLKETIASTQVLVRAFSILNQRVIDQIPTNPRLQPMSARHCHFFKGFYVGHHKGYLHFYVDHHKGQLHLNT